MGEREGSGGDDTGRGGGRDTVWLVIAWLVVGVPAAWGVWQLVVRSLALFGR